MVLLLDNFMSKCSDTLAGLVMEEATILIGVKGELQTLLEKMRRIQTLLKDAEKRKFDDSSIDRWLSELKDVMYDADDIVDLCRIKGPQLLTDKNPNSKTSPACRDSSSVFSSITSVPLRHEIGTRIKNLNDRLEEIYERRKEFEMREFIKTETPQITQVDHRQTSPMVDPLVVGREVEVAANELVNLLVAEKVEEKCRLFVVTGMGGIGKTTLAQKIFNHHKIQTYFKLKVWDCVSQFYSEIELLQRIIRGAKGSYGNANTKSELQPLLSESVAKGKSLFLVLDDVWRADVWVDLLRVPLHSSKVSVRVLVTTRYENFAQDMNAARTHPVMKLSVESGWDMLRKRLFSDEEDELANDLKELGYEMVKKCRRLPLAIKAIAGVLSRKDRTRKAWNDVLMDDAWSISKLSDEHRGALYLSYEDLPSHLKQCFLYFSLYPEDTTLSRRYFTSVWVAEGFVTESQNSLMENLAEEYFNELVNSNLLLAQHFKFQDARSICKMHDLFRSLAIFLSGGETSCGDANAKKNSTTSMKLRRLSVENKKGAAAAEMFDLVAEPEALRTLIASGSDLLLDDERLKRLLRLRVLEIADTRIEEIPDSIKNLVHLRYLDLDGTHITAIPESIEHLTNLQFLNIRACRYLTQLPSGITRLHNLRRLGLFNTPLTFIPKGIEKLQKLNDISGFVVANNESSSKLEELNSLKQLKMLSICNLERAQSGAIILSDLPCLTDLKLYFSENSSEPNTEEQLTVEKLFDELIPPQSLEELKITGFFGCRFPNWMGLSTFESCVPFLTRLEFVDITSCTQLPPLGQLPELRLLTIRNSSEVRKIGPEFLGGGVNSATRIAFPKLELLIIQDMPKLEEWSFGSQVEQNASPRLKLLPCLLELSISDCPLLEQLPSGLKHSAMKSLFIESVNSLKSVDDIPTETEVLQVIYNESLEKICCLPALKRLVVMYCAALSCVEELDSLQELTFFDYNKESLPEWLLTLLQQRVQHTDTNVDFLLQMQCSEKALRGCVEGGAHWELIQQIPRVIAYEDIPFGTGTGYLRYSKQPYVYDTNL
uniref:Putative disease resistance protein RGA4 isoform X3 n=1 Tax=Cymbidium sinense TaxID=112615 RepID=A0A5B8HWF7_9ASPA|nr:putative disease resistance protein RGA4 isoform X3 [Cymbidium sinense]